MLIVLGCKAVVDRHSSCMASHAAYPMTSNPSWAIFPAYGPQQPLCAHMAQVFRPFLMESCQILWSYAMRLVSHFNVGILYPFFLFVCLYKQTNGYKAKMTTTKTKSKTTTITKNNKNKTTTEKNSKKPKQNQQKPHKNK